MSHTSDSHRADAPDKLGCAVLTISDTRTLDTDSGGRTVTDLLRQAGHRLVDRQIVPDEPNRICPLLLQWVTNVDVDAILVTGGTGISKRDQTFETVRDLITKELPGYGELFRMLSYQEIGAAAMLSRAVGGLIEQTLLLTMPGSPAAVQLAMEKLVLPELGHLVHEARR